MTSDNVIALDRMTPAQALDIVCQATARLTGTRQDHVLLQRAEEVLAQAIATDAAEEAEDG